MKTNKLNFRTLKPVALCNIPNQKHSFHIRATDGTRFKIEVRLRNGCVSITGDVFAKHAKTPYRVGQIQDTLAEYGYNEQTCLWNKWHLNDFQAGTELQQAAVRGIEGYAAQCETLTHAGLLNDRGFIYGLGWLMKEITIEEWFDLLATFDRVVTA